MNKLKEIADQYAPTYGYNYAVLIDENGDIDEDAINGVCCNSCCSSYLKKLKTANKNAELINVSGNEEEQYPFCDECGVIIECGIIAQKQEIDYYLSLTDSDFLQALNEPCTAYQIYRYIHECENVSELIQRIHTL